MSDPSSADVLNRRRFLNVAGLAGAGAALSAMPAAAGDTQKPDPLITEVQDWQRYLGDGVDKRPYGAPSKFEHGVIRRDVPWLTASAQSSVSFTPLHALAFAMEVREKARRPVEAVRSGASPELSCARARRPCRCGPRGDRPMIGPHPNRPTGR
jgi:hypothetical protein